MQIINKINAHTPSTHTHTHWHSHIRTSTATTKSLASRSTMGSKKWRWARLRTGLGIKRKKKMRMEKRVTTWKPAELTAADYIIINLQASNEHTACVCLCRAWAHNCNLFKSMKMNYYINRNLSWWIFAAYFHLTTSFSIFDRCSRRSFSTELLIAIFVPVIYLRENFRFRFFSLSLFSYSFQWVCFCFLLLFIITICAALLEWQLSFGHYKAVRKSVWMRNAWVLFK